MKKRGRKALIRRKKGGNTGTGKWLREKKARAREEKGGIFSKRGNNQKTNGRGCFPSRREKKGKKKTKKTVFSKKKFFSIKRSGTVSNCYERGGKKTSSFEGKRKGKDEKNL